MAHYIFETHYGKSSLADEETGVVIEWINGKFNETQKAHCEGAVIPDGEDMATYMARKMMEMGDYIADNYAELV